MAQQVSPYKLFWNWCFDGNMKSEIPKPEILLKYNSPITPMFLLKSFINNGKLNHYLNSYLNNIGVHYIDKEDLFLFFKQCIKDFKVRRKDIHFIQYTREDILYEKLKTKLPQLKSYEINYLVNIINKSKDKESVYSAFGIDKPKKEKVKKKKETTSEKVSSKKFLTDNFAYVDI